MRRSSVGPFWQPIIPGTNSDASSSTQMNSVPASLKSRDSPAHSYEKPGGMSACSIVSTRPMAVPSGTAFSDAEMVALRRRL